MHYGEGSDGEDVRWYAIDGAFERCKDARKLALDALVNEVDGVAKEKYKQYHEVAADDNNCRNGEDVLVHAVGRNG